MDDAAERYKTALQSFATIPHNLRCANAPGGETAIDRAPDAGLLTTLEMDVALEAFLKALQRSGGRSRLGRGLSDDKLLEAIEDRFRELSAEAARLHKLINEASRRNLDWEVRE